MTQVTLRVLVSIIAQLGTLWYLPICKLYIPIFKRLRVHQPSAKVVSCQSPNSAFQDKLEGHSVYRAPTKVFRRLTVSVNKTIVKPRLAAAVGRKTILKPHLAAATSTYTSDFPDVKFRVAWLIR